MNNLSRTWNPGLNGGGSSWNVGFGSTTGFTTAGTHPISTTGGTSTTSIADLIEDLTNLEATFKAIEDRLDEGGVTMVGIQFNSPLFTEFWVTGNAAMSGSFVYILDAHALLTIGIGAEANTSSDVLTFEASSIKAGHLSEFESLVMTSFKLEIPPI